MRRAAAFALLAGLAGCTQRPPATLELSATTSATASATASAAVNETTCAPATGPKPTVHVRRSAGRVGKLDFAARWTESGASDVDDLIKAFVDSELANVDKLALSCGTSPYCHLEVACDLQINTSNLYSVRCSSARYTEGLTERDEGFLFTRESDGRRYVRHALKDLFVDGHARHRLGVDRETWKSTGSFAFDFREVTILSQDAGVPDSHTDVAALQSELACPYRRVPDGPYWTLGPVPERGACPPTALGAPLPIRVHESHTKGFPKRENLAWISTGVANIDDLVKGVIDDYRKDWASFVPDHESGLGCAMGPTDPCVLDAGCSVTKNDGRVFSVECLNFPYVGGFPNHAYSTGLTFVNDGGAWRHVVAGDLFIDIDGAASRVSDWPPWGEPDSGTWFAVTDEGLLFFPGYRKHAAVLAYADVIGELSCPFVYLATP
ncbi:MAG: hypothetical protein U0271_26010 [Polyangiaceae bacterium]